MRRFFIKQSETAGHISVITGTDARHIKNALRLKPGDIITLFDGAGGEYEARIISLSADSVNVSIMKSFPSTTESPIQIIVAQAFLKQRKMDNLFKEDNIPILAGFEVGHGKNNITIPIGLNATVDTDRQLLLFHESATACNL